MKKTIFIICLILLVFFHKVFGQEFSFNMTFIDAVGNTDTLIIGFDNIATDSVDAELGEVNIIDIELDSIFDVRITNEWYVRAWPGYQDKSKYHLLKQIVKKDCSPGASPVSIDIKCSHWPVTAKWDSSLFRGDPCHVGSVFTSMNPGLWWDIMTPSNLYQCKISEHDEVTFTSNADKYFYPGDFGEDSYMNSDHDTISVFWVALGTTAIWSYIDQKPYKNSIIIYPNPSHDYIRLNPENNPTVTRIEVYDLTGRKQDVAVCDNEIDISKLVKGLYCLKIVDTENWIIIKKFLKY